MHKYRKRHFKIYMINHVVLGQGKVCKCVLMLFFPPLYLFLHQGERLSHAVGCAFAACLERKQRREKECGVTASFDASRTSFVREGSFRANSSCSQQGSSSEREDKLQEKRKGRRFFFFFSCIGNNSTMIFT